MMARSVIFVVRPAVPADATAASALARRAKASQGYPPEWIEQWRDDLTMSRQYLQDHASFVAVSGNEIVGVCVLEARGDDASLEQLWVAPEYQQGGIGRALVERALEAARRAGVRHVEVESDPFAEAFYVRLGARRIGERPAPMPTAPERSLPVLEFMLEPLPSRASDGLEGASLK